MVLLHENMTGETSYLSSKKSPKFNNCRRKCIM